MTKSHQPNSDQTHAPAPGAGLFHPSFLAACVVLSLAAFVVGPRVLAGGGASDLKAAVALKKPLAQFEKKDLGPYRYADSFILNGAVVDALGTAEYMSWVFRDSTVREMSNPLRTVRVLVTYYSGGRDLVPHTPDQCYLGQGYQPVMKGDLAVDIPAVDKAMPLRVLTFARSAVFGRDEPTVMYTFHCNGRFMCGRNDVRYAIQAPSERYAYFCKIEVSFGSPDSQPANPSREDSVKAGARFLDQFLPVLLRDHLPDWDALHRPADPPAEAPTSSGV